MFVHIRYNLLSFCMGLMVLEGVNIALFSAAYYGQRHLSVAEATSFPLGICGVILFVGTALLVANSAAEDDPRWRANGALWLGTALVCTAGILLNDVDRHHLLEPTFPGGFRWVFSGLLGILGLIFLFCGVDDRMGKSCPGEWGSLGFVGAFFLPISVAIMSTLWWQLSWVDVWFALGGQAVLFVLAALRLGTTPLPAAMPARKTVSSKKKA